VSSSDSSLSLFLFNLKYADARFSHAFEGLEEARKSGNLGSNSEKRVAFAAADFETARSTARLLQVIISLTDFSHIFGTLHNKSSCEVSIYVWPFYIFTTP
jgi:hypothetical protein